MIKDIKLPDVKNVTLAVIREKNNLVASTGYGEKAGEKQRTSTLRHFLETVPARSSSLVEPIDSAVFHLSNEYWVSYYVGKEIFDKRFVFVPDSICEANLTRIKELDRDGILHS